MVGEGFCSRESAGEPHVEPCVCSIPVRCPVSPLQGSAIPAMALGVLTPGAAGSRAGLLPPSPGPGPVVLRCSLLGSAWGASSAAAGNEYSQCHAVPVPETVSCSLSG